MQSQLYEQSGIHQYLLKLGKWKRFIFLNVLGVTILSVAISFLLPKWYLSSTTVLPPKNQNMLSGLGLSSSALMRQLGPIRALGSLGQSPDIYGYLAILKSRSLLEKVVERFDLITVYGVKGNSISDAVEELITNVSFKVNEEGTLRVEVADQDPVRAARMADYFVEVLDEINRDLSVREAKSNREFIEQRVNQNIADLKKAEDDLQKFQERHGFVGVTEQNTGAINAIAELYSQKALKELEVGFLKRALGENNPLMEASEIQLSELNAKLKGIPNLGTEFLRLYREFAIQQKMFETLVPLLEQARIEEKRDTPTLLVLDKAVVPELAYRPKKRIIVLIFFILSLIISIAIALFLEKIERFKKTQPTEYETLANTWLHLFRK